MKLSDNDRQRIEQEAAKLFNRWDGGLENVQTMLLSIAEYATLYERQQHEKWVKLTDELLEAERSEVRSLLKEIDDFFGGEQLYKEHSKTYNLILKIKAALNL